MARSLASTLPQSARRLVYWLAWAAVLSLATFAAYTFSGVGSPALDRLFNDGLYNAVQLMAVAGCCLRLALVPADRVPWALITAGVASWATADMIFTFAYDNEPPYPSIADLFYLAFYPVCYVGLLLLVRRHLADFNRSLWLDGLTAGLGAAALGAAILVEIVLETTEGSRSVVITNLAYPIGDVLLLSMVVGAFAISGWRPGRAWLFVGLGFLCQVVADAAFLFQAATETYVPGAAFDVLWPVGMLLLAWASWQAPASGLQRREARTWLATPAIAALVAIAILVYDHFHRQNLLALGLSVATLVVVLVRLRMTFRENEQMLGQIRTQAVTDALTGLGNRRRLLEDLAHALATGDGAPARTLVIYDLNGFKRYNDTFGHPAGDALLQRLGEKLAAVVASRGAAYRLGGDEFCVLTAPESETSAELVERTVEALSEEGEGFFVTTSFGAVSLPSETSEPSEALRLADQRLYTQKHSSELARNRPHEVLLQALSEREPDLLEHSRSVAELSLRVGDRLALSNDERSVLRIAAELHDVGKLAIPDSILAKAEPLTEAEWEFVRRHTVIGQRIVAATPALQNVGRIVRASHERWDGEGYPDGLLGQEIPLEARIIAVCDTFKAMTSDRPYGQGMPAEDALAEIHRCAGTQFDPGVVAAFLQAVAADDARLAAAG
jgi:diguanylate cyclase (GGDEF)-like protein